MRFNKIIGLIDTFYKVATELVSEFESGFNPDSFNQRFISNIKEVKRPGKDVAGLGIQPNPDSLIKEDLDAYMRNGIANIKSVYNEATDSEKEYWGSWYYKARQDVMDLYQRQVEESKILHPDFTLNFNIVASVVATLSPGNMWLNNLRAAEACIRRYRANQFLLKNKEKILRIQSKKAEELLPEDKSFLERFAVASRHSQLKVSGFLDNILRAENILDTKSINVSGPKVIIFYSSLIDPENTKDHLVLDGHAQNIWRGYKVALKELPSRKGAKDLMKKGYAQAASELGISVQSLQAITWYVWKYTNP